MLPGIMSLKGRTESVNAAYSGPASFYNEPETTMTRICRATAVAGCWSLCVAVHRFAVHSASPTALVVHATNNHARPWPIHLVSAGSDWLAHIVRRVYGDARFTTRCVSQWGAFLNGVRFTTRCISQRGTIRSGHGFLIREHDFELSVTLAR